MTYASSDAVANENEFRVLGPPGTGKTTELSTRVEARVKKHGSESVLVMSLTRAAAAEVVKRDLPIDREQIGTLHAHAFRSLDAPKLAADRKHFEEWNSYVEGRGEGELRLSMGVVRDDFGGAEDDATLGDELFAEMDSVRAQGVPVIEWREPVQELHEMWSDWKAMHYLLDFTDLIEICLRDVERAPGNPQFIFLDEAQDFSRIELRLARKWALNADELVIAGDPDQSIFGWRGADARNFLTPEIPEDHYVELGQSMRVPKAPHRLAVEWIRQIKNRRDVKYLPTPMPGAVERVSETFLRPEAIFKVLEEHLAAGKEIMLLATASYMLKPLLGFFRREGIPFHNPYVEKRGDWNPLRTRRGAKNIAERIKAFLYGGWLEDPEELRAWLDLLKLDHFRAHRSVSKEFLRELRGPIDTTTLQSIFRDDALSRALQTDLAWLKEGLLSQYASGSSANSFDYVCRIAERFGDRGLEKKPQIIVGTVHSVKGGEADVVAVFPDISAAADRELHEGEDGRDATIRLMYVAFTRAKETLLLFDPATARAIDFPKESVA